MNNFCGGARSYAPTISPKTALFRQIVERSHAWQKEISPSFDKDKSGESFDLLAYGAFRDGHLSGAIVVANEGVFVVVKTVEARIVGPGLLDKLKLFADIGIETKEMESP